MKTALTIGGSDPTGLAGIQSDLSTFASFEVRGLSAITALTVQTGRKVFEVKPVSASLLQKQIKTLLKEYQVDAIKIGMLGTKENVETVRKIIKKRKLKNVVLDPVLASTSGRRLLAKNGIKSLKLLLPLVTIITPNISEAETISGIKIKNADDVEKAARKILSFGAKCVLIKGGHLEGAPIDTLFDGKRIYLYKGSRIKGRKEKFHGTGCLLSSAIATGLAKGLNIRLAVKKAKDYVRKTISKR
ncbi:MAG: bifunctional hydroxymethylpyrimidine kinase/phosphomethylpyrimidine kinase [Thermodesulfobacteriota bacterium]